jgi:hypothetical protein
MDGAKEGINNPIKLLRSAYSLCMLYAVTAIADRFDMRGISLTSSMGNCACDFLIKQLLVVSMVLIFAQSAEKLCKPLTS